MVSILICTANHEITTINSNSSDFLCKLNLIIILKLLLNKICRENYNLISSHL